MSFMARITMSFLKMVMKSRKRSTQCLEEEQNTHWESAAGCAGVTSEGVRVGVSSPHVVLVSVLGLLDDELSIEEHEAAHNEQPQVHVSLRRTQEDGGQNEGRDPREYGGDDADCDWLLP